jgi:hypothetical protein
MNKLERNKPLREREREQRSYNKGENYTSILRVLKINQPIEINKHE